MAPQGSKGGSKSNGPGKGVAMDDDYMMYTYKVIPCSRVSTHNWKLCHFSHVGEVAARRRHPSCHQADLCAYVSANKECLLGDSCPYAHNAFESWLHPDRYKTTLCSYAGSCTRKFCFFAHSASELRTPNKSAMELSCRLGKTPSLDTAGSVGTPNSATSNTSSSSMAGVPSSLQANWVAAAAAAAAGSQAGSLASALTAGPFGGHGSSSAGAALPGSSMYAGLSLQQQQQLAAAAQLEGLAAGAARPDLFHAGLAVNVPPQLSQPGAGVPMPHTATAAAAAAAGAGPAAMQFSWELSSLGSLLAPSGSGGTPMATDGSCTTSFSLCDMGSGSPTTPLAAAARGSAAAGGGSAANSPLLAGQQQGLGSSQSLQLAWQAALGANSAAATGSLASQQQQEGPLRQLLLQQQLSLMQQQQQRQQELALGLAGASSASWPLLAAAAAGMDVGRLSAEQQQLAALLLSQRALSQSPASHAGSPGPDLAPLAGLGAADWGMLLAHQQQLSGGGVLPGADGGAGALQAPPGLAALNASVGNLAAVAAAAAAAAGSPSTAGGAPPPAAASAAAVGAASSVGEAATQQLQQQLGMLSFAAMAQPA